MKINSYCFEKKNIWYFRKRIPMNLTSNKTIIYRRSLLRLLGKKSYYNSLLNGTLFHIANFINNNVEYLFIIKEKITLTDIDDYIKNLLFRYQREAINKEDGNFINNIGSKSAETEQLRFDALTYYDETGVKYAGHTPEALHKEKETIGNAFNSEKISLRKQKVNDILKRQIIISDEEFEKIPEERLKEFEEALLKIEIEVLNQDINNYNAVNKKTDVPTIKSENLTEDSLKKLLPKELIQHLQNLQNNPESNSEKTTTNNSDNWELLIDSYLNGKMKTAGNNTKRNIEIALNQFKDIMLGDENLEKEDGSNYKKLNIVDVITMNEINYIKNIFMEFPKLDTIELKNMFRTKGMLYTVEFAKQNRNKFPKNLINGLNTKLKIIKNFIEDVKDNSYDKYKSIDLNLWKKLSIKDRDLTKEDKLYNIDNKKLPLMSEDLSLFLTNKYDDTKIGKQLFTKHTSSSAHIFWSVMLGIFTGARAEELAQINIKNDLKKIIVDDEEIYYFYLHISDFQKQSLKNLSSSRNVPISKYLIDLGFLNYIDERIKNKKEYLFDLTINNDGKRKHFQSNFNKTFKPFFQNLHPNLEGQTPTYHSLRSHFVSKFLKDDKNEKRYDIINLKKLIGHTRDDLHKDITINSYFKEALDIKFSKELIDDMNFHIDDGYEKLKSLINIKYPKIIKTLDLDKLN